MTRSIVNYDRDIGWKGLIAPSNYPSAVASHALQANYAYLGRFVPSRNMLVDRIAYYVGTGTGSGASEVDVGIYDQNSDLVVQAHATTSKLTANDTVYAVTLFEAAALTAGTIYFAALSSNSTASLMCATWQTGVATTLFGTSWENTAAYYMPTSHPLPDIISAQAPATFVPILAVRES